MIPQPAPQSTIAGCTQPGAHLTEDQFAELLASFTNDASPDAAHSNPSSAEAHLLACEQCAGELAALRESLALFRHASIAYADSQLRGAPPLSIPTRTILRPALEPAYWLVAAAMLLTALLPLQLLRHHALPPPAVAAFSSVHSSASDEALLEDINLEISASLPTPMLALADPGAAMKAPVQNPTPRKD